MNFSFESTIELTTPWYIPFIIEGCGIAFLNILIIATFAVNAHLRKRSVYLLLSVSVADMIVGVTLVTYGLSIFYEGIRNDVPLTWGFPVVACFDMTSAIASLAGLVLVSLERMVAVVFPLRHRRFGNRPYVVSIGLEWISSMIFTPLLILNTEAFFLFAAIGAPSGLLIMCAAYLAIYIKVMKAKRQALNISAGQLCEQRLAKTLFIASALSVLTWVPDNLEDLVISHNSEYNMCSTLLRCANSLVNPLVYIFRIREFRRALHTMVCRCARDQHQPIRRLWAETAGSSQCQSRV
ncbi:adenosine receptor A3-like [Nematostella vectensis]|uniref:adenosine receptor A3-like n=1 Tax=Nematostella vectensis TaxID=45351 RepID=UPI002077341B|nr:adenosine receptor A3-like [Nematostella vectensis]